MNNRKRKKTYHKLPQNDDVQRFSLVSYTHLEYIPGSKNVVADVLSRVNLEEQTFEGEKESILKIYNIIKDRSDLEKVVQDISKHQQSDPKLNNIKLRLSNQDDTITKFYCVHNGILFIKTSLDEEIWKAVIPATVEKLSLIHI